MKNVVKAVYPGSFDPPTLGHLDIIQRAVKVFGELTVLVANSPRKNSLFTAKERKDLLEASISNPSVKIDFHGGLTVDYMKQTGSNVIIRGLRAVSDFEYEFQMATMNHKLDSDIETFLIMTGEEFFYISSNTVKEVALHGGNVEKLVPPVVVEALRAKLKG